MADARSSPLCFSRGRRQTRIDCGWRSDVCSSDLEGLAADDEALHLIAKSADGGMRDGLSILDQVVSFGEGPVTAARVREVLGLISDDVYGELLRLVSERDPKAVVPLVERLGDAVGGLGGIGGGGGGGGRGRVPGELRGEP